MLLALTGVVALGLVAIVAYPNLLPEVIREKIASITSKAQSSTAYLGVEIQDLKESMAEALGLRSTSGVVITRVIASSPAAESGLKLGDIILQHDRLRVKNSSELQDMLAEASPGDTARIVVDRDGQVRTFYVELAQRPSYLMQAAYTSPGQTDSNPEWGCTLSPLTPELARQLSLPSSIKGVVVVAVASSGFAKTAGVLPGDVIVSVNRQPTQDLASFYKAIENQQSVVLQIYRSGQAVYVQLNVSSASPPLATIAGSVAESAPTSQRVAVAANGSDLNAQLAVRFGTAPYFVIADLGTNRFQAIQNNTLADSRGYGIAAAQLVAARGAGAAIAGAYGPQAYDALNALNIVPFTANPGKVSDVLNQYRSALLTQVTDPTLPGYGYARSIIATGGSPFSSEEEEEEEEGGYKGMPYTIPPQGKYDPEQDPANALQNTAGSSQRTDYCYCPTCRILVPHPPSVPCSELTCPQCGNRLMNWDSGALAPGASAPLANYGQVPVLNQSQTRTGSAAIVPVPGISPGAAGTLNLNQQTQYCYCPTCNIVYEHPAGVPCSSLVCSACGSRLISLSPGSGSPLPAAQTSAGTVVAGQPGTIPPMGQTSAGTVIAGQPGTIPPMGQTSAGTVVGGQPETIPPMGQVTADTTLPTGVLQGTIDGNCVCPKCGTTVPHVRGTACYTIPCPRCGTLMVREGAVINPWGVAPQYIYPTGQTSAGTLAEPQLKTSTSPLTGSQTPFQGTPQRPSYAGAAKGQRDLNPGALPTGQTSAGITVAGPSNMPSGGQPQMGATSRGQALAGTVVAGQPGTIPPMGQILAGTVVGGQPETIPPMGQISAGVTVAGIPNISTGILVGGQPETIPPMGQTSALTEPASSAVTVAAEDSGKICIAVAGSTMDAPVAALFDRAPYFLIVGLGSFRSIPNPNASDLTGVGVQSAQLAVSEGARAVITDDIGVKAMEELARLRVRVYTGVNASANQAMAWYQDGRLSPSTLNASVADEEEEHGPPSSSKAKAKGESSSRTL
ncbi:MAG: PDZ domain-containing protein [Deltaproteobacteria bacterium]|nr:PDZ domain-containing protein [Deltaproteobacteria bacterium]